MQKNILAIIGFVAVIVAMQLAGGMFKAHEERLAQGGGCRAGCWRVQVEGVYAQPEENPYLSAAVKQCDARIAYIKTVGHGEFQYHAPEVRTWKKQSDPAQWMHDYQ